MIKYNSKDQENLICPADMGCMEIQSTGWATEAKMVVLHLQETSTKEEENGRHHWLVLYSISVRRSPGMQLSFLPS